MKSIGQSISKTHSNKILTDDELKRRNQELQKRKEEMKKIEEEQIYKVYLNE